MRALEVFLQELDVAWKPLQPGKQVLRIIGCGSLLLQTDYQRGTKDSDVLEAADLDAATKNRLLAIAGQNSKLHTRHRLFLEVVGQGLPCLAQNPVWHTPRELDERLNHFSIHVLDIVDVVVSKLARFHSDDRADIQAMVARGLVPHHELRGRFEAAKNIRQDTGYADDLPKYVANLNRVERDYLGVDESEIDLPPWVCA